jgi:hypothetical protein
VRSWRKICGGLLQILQCERSLDLDRVSWDDLRPLVIAMRHESFKKQQRCFASVRLLPVAASILAALQTVPRT